jgi:hypothetical protein
MKKVTLKSSFEEILGKTAEEYPEEVRKQRWEEWKACARKKKDGQDTIDSWSDQTACVGCIHLNKEQSWCNAMGLPCTVNPILSFQMGMVGMACMGTGYEAQTQLELFTK